MSLLITVYNIKPYPRVEQDAVFDNKWISSSTSMLPHKFYLKLIESQYVYNSY